MIGDLIKVITHQGKVFGGYVHVVESLDVGLHLHSSFPNAPGQVYDIDFSLSLIPLQRMHQALKETVTIDRLTFPVGNMVTTTTQSPSTNDIRSALYNTNIANNGPQLQAVASIVSQPPGSVPFVVFGP